MVNTWNAACWWWDGEMRNKESFYWKQGFVYSLAVKMIVWVISDPAWLAKTSGEMCVRAWERNKLKGHWAFSMQGLVFKYFQNHYYLFMEMKSAQHKWSNLIVNSGSSVSTLKASHLTANVISVYLISGFIFVGFLNRFHPSFPK